MFVPVFEISIRGSTKCAARLPHSTLWNANLLPEDRHFECALARNGIRRQRLADSQILLVMVIDDQTETFAFFQLEELLILLGHPPSSYLFADLLDVSRRYGMPA